MPRRPSEKTSSAKPASLKTAKGPTNLRPLPSKAEQAAQKRADKQIAKLWMKKR